MDTFKFFAAIIIWARQRKYWLFYSPLVPSCYLLEASLRAVILPEFLLAAFTARVVT